MKQFFILFIVFFISLASTGAQENVGPLLGNAALSVPSYTKKSFSKRSTPILLPLFDNFHSVDTSPYPIDNWWIDSAVYINNTFTDNHYNKGIATFDVIDKYGKNYHSTNPDISRFCDSLTSYAIDLSGNTAGDSIYLSFDFVTKGLGFQPKPLDSLLVFFKDSVNGWSRVAHLNPDSVTSWRTKMIAVKGANYFYDNFQFRIINKGTVGASSAHWHIDNVYMNTGRSITDTQINDVAFSAQPTSLLNDFTAMPFKHFATDRNSFLSDNFTVKQYNKNYTGTMHTGSIMYTAKNKNTGTLYGTNNAAFSLPANSMSNTEIATYNVSSLSPDAAGNLTVSHQFYFNPIAGDNYRFNDSIVQNQVFGNYFAYDDGSAEQSYYLNLAPATPGKIAVEYATYVNDTIAGVAIQFAPQVPTNEYKEFIIQIYKSIEVGGSGGELLYQEEGFYPNPPTNAYAYYTYPLKTPVPVGVGVYYVVIMMPASGISDSLMIGLDRNRIGGNHRYYNVLDVWESSLLEGALLIRPVMGGQKLSSVETLPATTLSMDLYPNPTQTHLHIRLAPLYNIQAATYRIVDVKGSTLLKGTWQINDPVIAVQSLSAGSYFIQISTADGKLINSKFVKN